MAKLIGVKVNEFFDVHKECKIFRIDMAFSDGSNLCICLESAHSKIKVAAALRESAAKMEYIHSKDAELGESCSGS